MENVSASQSETIQEEVKTADEIAMQDALEAFGISKDKQEPEETKAEETPAATQEETKPESKKMRVRYNKEDVEIDETQVPELVQKGLALDKVREQAKQRETELDRAAKLLGYKDHAELTANLDRIEQERIKKQEDDFSSLTHQIVQELMDNGISEESARAYAENNPLVKQARAALEEKQQFEQQRQQQTVEQQRNVDWMQLYEAFPDAAEAMKTTPEGELPAWYSAEMQSLIQMGYKPLHAYKLAHMDTIQSQTKKQVEQKLIKEQRLGSRSQVVTDAKGSTEEEVPEELASAFSLFGLPVSAAKKYVKK